VAVKLWFPAPSDDVVNVAVSPLLSVLVPNATFPSENVTLPVAVPAPGATGATVAVSVTDWPKFEGLGATFNAVVVEAWNTVSVPLLEVTV
jgi:hypothetical protein